MNKESFEGKGKEGRGRVKRRWKKLTDDDMEHAGGKAEQLIDPIQQKSGTSRRHAEEEFPQRGQTMLDADQDLPA